jgi:hypothetical protein
MRPSQLHVFPFVLLLVTFKSTLGFDSCKLCLDGSTITKPDYFISITTPFVINTCKDFSDGLLFVESDSSLCRDARGEWSAICGCPVAEDACSICEGSQNITKPQQVLDGLVDFTNADIWYFDFLSLNGIAFTCALAESRMQIFQNGQTECLELPFDDLRRCCGCPSEDKEESTECTLCPGGEIAPDQSGVDIISCKNAKTLLNKTEKGTEECNQIQRVSTQCG